MGMGRFRWLQRIGGWVLLGLLTLGLVVGGSLPGSAQIPVPNLGTTPTEAPAPPSDVRRIGTIEVMPLVFQGQSLFEITAETVYNRSALGEQIPVEVRVRGIQESLSYIISLNDFSLFDEELTYSTIYDPDTLLVRVSILNEQTILTAADANRSAPQVLMTVTDRDAEYQGIPKDELAQNWRERLQLVLVEELRDRQPEALWEWLRLSAGVLILLLGMSGGGWFLRKRLSRRKHRLQLRQQDESPDRKNADSIEPETDPAWQLELLEALERYFDLEQRLRWLDFLRWLLTWGQITLWIVGIAVLIDALPLSQATALDVLISPLLIFLIWGAAGLIKRLVDLAINRGATFWRTQNVMGDVQRRSLRITTLANVLKGMATFLIYFVSVLYMLELLGFSTQSVLAFGAILGFAVSLASQNLIRDLVNGFLILLEDQFAIGDVIAVDGVSGFVENLNLRTTHLRDGEGRLIVLPNSLINRVENLTRTWARVDHTITVASDTNVHHALEVIHTVAQEMYDDPDWRSLLIEPPEVLGIDDVSHEGILIRTWLKTQPLKQWLVGREFRLRLKAALDQHHIELGMPQQREWHLDTAPSDAPDSFTNGHESPPSEDSSESSSKAIFHS